MKRTTPAFEAMVSVTEHRPDPKRRPAFPRVTPGAGPQRQSESRCSTEQRKQGVTETDGGGAGGGGTLSREVGRGRGGPSEEPPGSHNHALTRTSTRMPAPPGSGFMAETPNLASKSAPDGERLPQRRRSGGGSPLWSRCGHAQRGAEAAVRVTVQHGARGAPRRRQAESAGRPGAGPKLLGTGRLHRAAVAHMSRSAACPPRPSPPPRPVDRPPSGAPPLPRN